MSEELKSVLTAVEITIGEMKEGHHVLPLTRLDALRGELIAFIAKVDNATITTDNTKAAAMLTIRLREANALIDTLEGALESIRGSDKTALAQSWVYINPICDKALAEAKKWKGEV